MKVTITIKVNKNKDAFANAVHSLLPTKDQLKEYAAAIVPAVLPVKFRIAENQRSSAFIQFDD
jgi:hypothetical protein